MPNRMENRSAALLLIAALSILFVLSTPSYGGDVSEEATPLYQAFESRYDEIQQAVKRGALPDEASARAEDLWVSLRKDLISRNARIDILKLEVSQYSGDRQQRALDELVRETAAREGMIANYLGKLDSIAAEGGSEASVIAVPEVPPRVMPEPAPEQMAPVKTKSRAESPPPEPEPKSEEGRWGKKSYKVKNLEIEIGPEDIITEEQHMP